MRGRLRAIAVRSAPGTTLDDVRAAFDAGELVRSWAMRGTLFVAAPDDPTHAADHTDHAADDADHPAHVAHHVAHVSERPLDEPPAATAEPDAVRDWHGDAARRVAHTGLRPHLRHHAAAHTGPRPVDEPDGCAVGRPERRPALSR